jgi:hypothetical protein
MNAPRDRATLCSLTVAALVFTSLSTAPAAPLPPLYGFNIIATNDHPFGTESAGLAIAATRRLGAGALAIVPFLWQATPSSAAIERGGDMPDDELRAAIRQIRAEGLRVVIKPHVWVPQSWAGAIMPQNEGDWQTWFAGYERAVVHLALVASEEGADAFVVGTELRRTVLRPEWTAIVAKVRSVYPGPIFYVSHNVEGAEQVPFWPLLDAVGVSNYPPLGADEDRVGRNAVIEAVAERIDALSRRVGKPVIVGEVGLRSAEGAAAMPWQSAEERTAAPAPSLQADVLADWLRALDRPSVHGVMIWRWLTDPAAGGLDDTDFTVQGKPAEQVLQCAWTGACAKAMAPPRQNR